MVRYYAVACIFTLADQADLELWLFAVMYAVILWNHIPRGDTSLSPIELFSGNSKSHLRHLYIWVVQSLCWIRKFKMAVSCLKGLLVLTLANSLATQNTILHL